MQKTRSFAVKFPAAGSRAWYRVINVLQGCRLTESSWGSCPSSRRCHWLVVCWLPISDTAPPRPNFLLRLSALCSHLDIAKNILCGGLLQKLFPCAG